MKNTYVIAALLGLVSVGQAYREGRYVVRETPLGSLFVQNEEEFGWDEKEDDIELLQRQASQRSQVDSESSSSDSDSDDDQDKQNLQLGDDETYGDKTYFAAGDQGMTPNGVEYVRTLPEQFNEESPNKFMKNIIENYALEQKTEKGEPSGTFKMDKKQTMAASRDAVQKAKKIEGKELDSYMNQYFSRTWEHFDVNNDQLIDALDMPAFEKYFMSDQGVDLDALYAWA